MQIGQVQATRMVHMDAQSRLEGPLRGVDEKTGRRRVVVIDDTNVVRHRRSFSGFCGRTTARLQTIVLAGVELDHEFDGRRETRRVFLFLVPNREKDTLQKVLRKRALGSFGNPFSCFLCGLLA